MCGWGGVGDARVNGVGEKFTLENNAIRPNENFRSAKDLVRIQPFGFLLFCKVNSLPSLAVIIFHAVNCFVYVRLFTFSRLLPPELCHHNFQVEVTHKIAAQV